MANAEGQRALSHSPIKGRDRHISGPRSSSGALRRNASKCMLCCAVLGRLPGVKSLPSATTGDQAHVRPAI